MNKLSTEVLESFEDHLLVCAGCQDRVTETDGFLSGMRAALANPVPQASGSRWNLKELFRMPAPVWAAAGVAAVGLLGVIATHDRHDSSAPLAIALTATRGGQTPNARAGNPLSLDLDVRGLGPLSSNQIQIVNSEGNEVWSGPVSAVQNGHVHAMVASRLSPGQYFVRIVDPVGAHREYALRLGN